MRIFGQSVSSTVIVFGALDITMFAAVIALLVGSILCYRKNEAVGVQIKNFEGEIASIRRFDKEKAAEIKRLTGVFNLRDIADRALLATHDNERAGWSRHPSARQFVAVQTPPGVRVRPAAPTGALAAGGPSAAAAGARAETRSAAGGDGAIRREDR